MKLFIVTIIIAATVADHLENTYLPPVNAKTADGSGIILAAPHQNFHTNSISSYAAPASGPVTSSLYDSPSTKTNLRQSGEPVAILRFNNDNSGEGTHKFEYETANHISQQEYGQLKNKGSEQEATVVQGSYSYTGPDGKSYTVNYIADENGFRASGDHLPTPPPVPDAILKCLEINSAANVSSTRSGYSTVLHPERQYLTPHAESVKSYRY